MASQETKTHADGAVKELSAADLQKRAGLIKELISTEENYIEDLKIIIEASYTADSIFLRTYFDLHLLSSEYSSKHLWH